MPLELVTFFCLCYIYTSFLRHPPHGLPNNQTVCNQCLLPVFAGVICFSFHFQENAYHVKSMGKNLSSKKAYHVKPIPVKPMAKNTMEFSGINAIPKCNCDID